MNIVVCIKQVPDTTEVRLDPKTGTLIREGVPTIMNPDDKSALELALQLKDQLDGHVIVVSMGPPQAEQTLREALAMGANEAYLITDRAFAGADTWATSKTIAAAINKFDYDLVICGRQAIDGDTAQVGPQICEHLGIPQVTYCESIEIEKGDIIVIRQFEDRYHKIKLSIPCGITALSECIKPRYMSIRGVIEAYDSKQIKNITFDDLDLKREEIGLKGSPTRVKKSMTKGIKASGEKFEVEVDKAVELILEDLAKNNII